MARFNEFLCTAVICALPLSALAGDVVLTLTHDGQVTEYDMDQLQALGTTSFDTSTIWTEGVQAFTGVPLVALLTEHGIDAGSIKATAINDYAVEIPVSDAVQGGPIIATLRNGDAMSVRDKGPLWIVYPYDSNPAYQSEVIYSRSIWQLDRISTED